MSEPVQIGIKEVYDAIASLTGRFEGFSADQKVAVALLRRDVDDLKADMAKKDNKGWQVKLALFSSIACPIIVAVVLVAIVGK